MALKIIDAKKSGFPHDGRFGWVHLIFDRDIGDDPLRLSVLKLLGREYLGRSSPPKANWTPARSHFFDAPLVSRDGGQTVFSLGPEVTTFIPDESMLELASEDNLVRETAVWSGVSVDFTWPGPPAVAAPEPQKPRLPEPRKAPTPSPVVPEVVKPDPVVEVPDPPQPPDPPPVISSVPQPPAPPAKRGLRAAMMALGVLLVAVIGGVYWVSQHRDYLCDRYHLFCDPEVLAYRAASDCAAPKACGVTACLAHYRDTYPNGRFSADIESIAIKKGRDCPVENPPPAVDPEKVAYDRVQACATSRTCGASVCVAEYRQSFPNGAHKVDVDRIVAEKGADCIDPAVAAAAATEKEVYDQAVGCARPRTCGALECVADYRRRYPNGRYKAPIDQIVAQKGATCEDPVEKAEYERADACARSKSCGALDCVADYRRDYPSGRYKAQIDQIAQAPSAALCPDLDREAYDRAEHCAEPLRCGADHCLIEYRRDFPNGKYRSLIDQIGAMKGPACTPPPTPPSPVTPPSPDLPPINRRTNEDAGLNCGKADLEPIEQMVCADADMARANADLQKLYFQKRRQLSSADARKDLYDQEMNWIDQRNADCGVPRSGTWSEMELRKLKSCFIDHTRARVNELR
jgi:uncharacterized protein YecT (DUF1311 family)